MPTSGGRISSDSTTFAGQSALPGCWHYRSNAEFGIRSKPILKCLAHFQECGIPAIPEAHFLGEFLEHHRLRATGFHPHRALQGRFWIWRFEFVDWPESVFAQPHTQGVCPFVPPEDLSYMRRARPHPHLQLWFNHNRFRPGPPSDLAQILFHGVLDALPI